MLHLDPSSPVDLALHSLTFWLATGGVYAAALIGYFRKGWA
jgi:hypothetical protein